MSENNWAEVDTFIADLFVNPDPALDAALAESERAGLPAIEVSAPAGKLLMLFARMIGAKRILGSRNARRLLDHLAGKGAAEGRPAHHA